MSLVTIFVIFIAIVILDYIWLGHITSKFIAREFGKNLVVLENNEYVSVDKKVGILTWLILALGVYAFVVSQYDSLLNISLMGALFGFVVYCVYDLTNLTFIKKYPRKFAIIDIIWGSFIGMSSSIVGFLFMTLF